MLKINGLKIFGESNNKTSIISFNINNLHPYDIGVLLDKMGVAIRTGHHCTQHYGQADVITIFSSIVVFLLVIFILAFLVDV